MAARTHKQQAPLGLIAGNGQLPHLFARAAKACGRDVVAVGHLGETDPSLRLHVRNLHFVRVGALGGIIKHFKRHGVNEAAMAGGINKRRLLHTLRPDWTGLHVLWTMAQRGDDAMLRSLAAAFEARGINIIASTIYLPDALTPEGILGHVRPTPGAARDLTRGLELARSIGALDVGQTVALRDGTVVALEALEGTDACIQRAGALCRGRGVVVVKAAKPHQDMRFDVPTLGPQTVRTAKAAGVIALGAEAGRTLLLQPQQTVAIANAAGIALVGLG